jgi:hypothetical protein
VAGSCVLVDEPSSSSAVELIRSLSCVISLQLFLTSVYTCNHFKELKLRMCETVL